MKIWIKRLAVIIILMVLSFFAGIVGGRWYIDTYPNTDRDAILASAISKLDEKIDDHLHSYLSANNTSLISTLAKQISQQQELQKPQTNSGGVGGLGDTGIAGAIGSTGEKGDKGDTGSTGATGSTGPSGTATLTADSLDFVDFQDQLDLDASTDILASGTNILSLTNIGTGNSFLVNDSSSDTTPFVIDAIGNVGIGITAPTVKLEVDGTIKSQNLDIPDTTSSTTGIIYKDGSPYFHNYAGNGNGGNIFIGEGAGNFTLALGLGTASGDIGIGINALKSITSGEANTGVGTNTGEHITSGFGNTFFGSNVGRETTTGNDNLAVGASAFQYNTTGGANTAVGILALAQNVTGSNNVAVGWGAAEMHQSGTRNIAIGIQSYAKATAGSTNTAVGAYSLFNALSGGGNVALGDTALYLQTSGDSNTAIGAGAGYTENAANANVSGIRNTWIGFQAGPGTATQLTNSIGVGYQSHPTASNQAVFGNSSTTSTILYGGVRLGANGNANDVLNTTSGSAPSGNLFWGNRTICDSSGNCSVSSSWSSLTNPTGNLSLSMGANTSTFTYNAATGSSNLFNLTDTTGNTGTGYLVNLTTASGSTLKPFHVSAAGVEAINVDALGRVGIGTTSFTSGVDKLEVVATNTAATSGSNMGLRSVYTVTPPSNSTGSYASIYGSLQLAAASTNITGGSSALRFDVDSFSTGSQTRISGVLGVVTNRPASGTVTNLYGNSIEVSNRSSGSVTNMIGYTSQLYNSGTAGNVATALGFRLETPSFGSAGAFTNFVGFNTPVMTHGTNNTHVLLGQTAAPTGNFGIYNASTYSNYLAGNLGIGDTTPTEAHLVIGSAGVGNVFFTPDTTGTTDNAVCWDNSGATLLYDCDNTPADYAESYPVEKGTTYGEIMMTSNAMVTTKVGTRVPRLVKAVAGTKGSVIGITSNNYHDFTSAGKDEIDGKDNPMPVALNGRVPVKIASDSASIEVGDYLTISSTPGQATKATKAGQMVGKALEEWTPHSASSGQAGTGVDTIMVFVDNSYADPNGEGSATTDLAHISALEDTVNLLASGSAVLSSSTVSDDNLSLDNLPSDNATLSGTLRVAGRTLLADIGITGTINAGLLSINGLDSNCQASTGSASNSSLSEVEGCATLNTTSGPLMLQSDGINGIDILAGKVTIEPNGNMKVTGEITTKKVNIQTQEVASASLGEGIIKTGETKVTIKTSGMTDKSHVFTSPNQPLDFSIGITGKKSGESFDAEISRPATKDISFSWWIIN